MPLGYQNLLKDHKIVFSVSHWTIKETRKQDWNNFTHQIHDSLFLVFMMQILLPIELPNNGELGEKGQFMEEQGGF